MVSLESYAIKCHFNKTGYRRVFVGRLRGSHGDQTSHWKVGVGWCHLLGHWLCQEEPARSNDQDILLQRLDQHHHQILTL